MSLSATLSDRAGPSQGIDTRILLLIIWLATVASYLVTSIGRGDLLSTDDAMRLVQVRDFLAGQGWFDVTQYRLSPPDGVAMHWSRLIDLPLALLIRAGETVLAPALAERVAVFVWPATLLLVFLGGAARLARALGDDGAAGLALIFAALMAPVLQHFRPGAIDHHNVQLALLVWSLALACRDRLRPRDAATAAVLSALSLAIGVEMAPAIGFGLAFASTTALLWLATVPPAHYGVGACDALSVVQVAIAAIGGGGLALLAAVPGLASPWRRGAGAGALAILLAAVVVFAFPACLGDPYAHLDARLTTLWLANVNEARSVATVLRDLPQELLLQYGLPAVALVLGGALAWRGRNDARWPWLTALAVLAALFAVALWQVRGAAAANAVALALVPAALTRLLPILPGRPSYLGLSRAALLAVVLLNPLTLIAVGAGAARALAATTGTTSPLLISEGPGTCRAAADYRALASLPKGLVLGFIDAGPLLLMETSHTALAAPYHRNLKGNAAMLDVFLGSPDETRARLAALGVDYVAFCPGAPERHNYAAAAPHGLAAALAGGEAPAFLERIPLDRTHLAVYRVKLD